ncbi:hypothetical protein [Beijerinckia sp. L45]|uniref:hypothetical protein n=1 Tax=Beijerinckia sp. L45 TaxID=1641855 RepID=UPI00131DD740|nr:hypothetical protein [Beijerinckia sp. L45]
MTSTILNLRIQPYRLFTKVEAAAYCRRSTKKFEGQCPVAPIVMADGDKLWDVVDLDKWIDSLKAGHVFDSDDIISKLS